LHFVTDDSVLFLLALDEASLDHAEVGDGAAQVRLGPADPELAVRAVQRLECRNRVIQRGKLQRRPRLVRRVACESNFERGGENTGIPVRVAMGKTKARTNKK
jgi:hypothetical protein